MKDTDRDRDKGRDKDRERVKDRSQYGHVVPWWCRIAPRCLQRGGWRIANVTNYGTVWVTQYYVRWDGGKSRQDLSAWGLVNTCVWVVRVTV